LFGPVIVASISALHQNAATWGNSIFLPLVDMDGGPTIPKGLCLCDITGCHTPGDIIDETNGNFNAANRASYNLTEEPIILLFKNLTMAGQGQGAFATLSSFIRKERIWIYMVGGRSWTQPGSVTVRLRKRRRRGFGMSSAKTRDTNANTRSRDSVKPRNAERKSLGSIVREGSSIAGRF
jgi:hypothetical protein